MSIKKILLLAIIFQGHFCAAFAEKCYFEDEFVSPSLRRIAMAPAPVYTGIKFWSEAGKWHMIDMTLGGGNKGLEGKDFINDYGDQLSSTPACSLGAEEVFWSTHNNLKLTNYLYYCHEGPVVIRSSILTLNKAWFSFGNVLTIIPLNPDTSYIKSVTLKKLPGYRYVAIFGQLNFEDEVNPFRSLEGGNGTEFYGAEVIIEYDPNLIPREEN